MEAGAIGPDGMGGKGTPRVVIALPLSGSPYRVTAKKPSIRKGKGAAGILRPSLVGALLGWTRPKRQQLSCHGWAFHGRPRTVKGTVVQAAQQSSSSYYPTMQQNKLTHISRFPSPAQASAWNYSRATRRPSPQQGRDPYDLKHTTALRLPPQKYASSGCRQETSAV